MRLPHSLVLALALVIFACQPTALPNVTIIDNNKVITLQTDERVPSTLLSQAGITLNPSDRLLLNGLPITVEKPIPNYPITLQIRRAVPITLITSDGTKQLQSSAFTVGDALQEVSFSLHAIDKIAPTLDMPVKVG